MSIKDLAQQMASQGRFGDSMLVHINPEEAALLKSLGGAGTINPVTGLPEYWGLGGIFRAVTNPIQSVVNTIGDIGQGAIDTVSDVGSKVDDLVNQVPGGWATAALLAAPYLAPEVAAAESVAAAEAAGAGSAGSMAAADAVYAGATTPAWETALADVAIPAIPASELAAVPTGIEALPIPDAMGTPSGLSAYESALPAAETGIPSLTTPAPVSTGLEGLPAEPADPTSMTGSGVPSGPPPLTPLTASGELASPGIFQSIADATGLPLGVVTALGTALGISTLLPLLSPSQAAQPQGVPQTPVGVGLSPNYQPYRYKPYAAGGIATLAAGGGPVERMSDANAVGANTGYPMADIVKGAYATPYQQPISQNVLTGGQDTRVDPYTGEERLAGGGIADLGGYSDGGRLLRGPGDGVSDSIPATIGGKQPARLADGEFVVPARIVSEIGNGSTDAGARKLYEMMDRVQSARRKTMGKKQFAKDTKAEKFLPV